MTSPGARPERTAAEHRNRSLDFLRGLAILGVVCVHCDLLFPPGNSRIDGFFRLGQFGVQLFFYVSAMTMCLMWDQRQGESHRTGKFYFRRFARIAPLFWLAIPVYLYLNGRGPSHWAPGGISEIDIALTATFLHGFWPNSITSVVPGGWSIAVEMTFYAVFPLLILRAGRKIPFIYYAAGTFFFNLLVMVPLGRHFFGQLSEPINAGLLKDFFRFQFFNQLFVFLLGMHLYQRVWQGRAMRVRDEILLGLGWFALLGLWSWHSRDARDLVAFFWVICGFVIAAGAVGLHWKNRVLEMLGRKSYSIYLSHFGVITLVKYLFDGGRPRAEGSAFYFMAGFLCVLAISYAIATVSYYLVEQPLHRFALKMTGRQARRS